MNNSRTNQILELLTKENRMEVASFSELLGVSQVTIRKDLDYLEQKGIIKREHGYAVLSSPDNISARIAYHYEEKRKIAAAAAKMVSDGDTIMIESGSCCALLAEELANTRKNLTIITNSAFIVDYIRDKADFQMILLGGIYQKDSQVMVGPMVRQCADNFFVKHFFIGTDGYSDRIGFTNRDQLRAQAVRDMAHQAEKVIIVTESEKFQTYSSVPLNLKYSKIELITDDKISPVMLEKLSQQNIETILA